MGAQVLVATYQNSSKAQALTLAMHSIDVPSFDMVVIMDADNTTTPHLLHELNKASAVGVRAIQAHRTAKNLNTDIALLDAASEEINNGIFRKGHVAIGFSCALIGSGMAFEADWFARHVEKLQTAGEDKELETLLQREQIYVDYLSEIDIYDEKTQKKKSSNSNENVGSLHNSVHYEPLCPICRKLFLVATSVMRTRYCNGCFHRASSNWQQS